jgi:alkylhydroperoxidase family enzyme
MSRIDIPTTVDAAPSAARPMLESVQRRFDSLPNLFWLIGNSSIALEGCLNLSAVLRKGSLPTATRERIALAIAQINEFGYCLAAHT